MSVEQIGGVEIKFPYVPYDCQRSFMEKVVEAISLGQNAALESPTGTGKTLSLLCAALGWIEQQKTQFQPQHAALAALINPNNGAPKDPTQKPEKRASLFPRIIYASRTHSQLQQVVRELNKTVYKAHMKVAVLGGRDQLCLNEKVMKEENSQIKAQMCRNLIKGRRCHYHNTLEKDAPLMENMYKEEYAGEVMDIEDLTTAGRKFKHCPFFASRAMHEVADLILLPYNYVLDPKIREAHSIELKGNILIFDEAHNLENIAEDSVSMELSTKTVALCIREAKATIELLLEHEEKVRFEAENAAPMFHEMQKKGQEKKPKDEEKLTKADVAQLLVWLHNFEDELDKIDLATQGQSVHRLPGRLFPGSQMVDLLERAGFRRCNRDAITSVIDNIGLFLARNAQENGGLWAERGIKLAEFSSFISRVLMDTFEQISLANGRSGLPDAHKDAATKNFRLYVTKEGDEGLKLQYWCFSPAVAMRFLRSRGPRSIILASGTLSPMNHFISSMGIPFGPTLEGGHAASTDQVVVGIVRKGPDGEGLVGDFSNRDNVKYIASVGELVLRAASTTPQGMLVFFASYKQMENFVRVWRTPQQNGSSSLWTLMEKQKKLYTEPKNKAEVSLMFREFDSAIREGKGAVLLAICRGKVSEGIDFADSHCRTVVIVGIPYPPLIDPRIMLKKEFLRTTKADGDLVMNPDDWYKIEGIRAVNQALGRIIRHKDDFGAVILADARYASTDRKLFPSWVRPAIHTHDKATSLFEEMERFFSERGLRIQQSQRRLQLEAPTGQRKQRGPTLRIASDESEARRPLKRKSFMDELAEQYGDAIREAEQQQQTGANCGTNSACGSTPTSSDTASTSNALLSILVQKSSAQPSTQLSTAHSAAAPPSRKKLCLKKGTQAAQDGDHGKLPPTSVDVLLQNLKRLAAERKTALASDDRSNDGTGTIATTAGNIGTALQATCSSENAGMQKEAVVRESGWNLMEYKQLMRSLPQPLCKELLSAQKAYISDRNYAQMVSVLRRISLPSTPKLFTGFYNLLHEEHREEFKKMCAALKLHSLS
ncbi:BCH-1 protein [Aphelenchoides avenae]|nr:BCH-1 protein [Aphelenchus avenae]